MGLKKLKDKIVFLDTAPLIYFIEENSSYDFQLKSLFKQNNNGDFLFITSAITLLEVLVVPIRAKRYDLVIDVTQIFFVP